MKSPFVINIGRQLGSGGRSIGRLLSESLHIKYYDKEILQLAAQESGFTPEVFARNDERKGFFHSLLGNLAPVVSATNHELYSNSLSDENLFRIQADAIKRAAAEHSCIFIGRCANYVLREHPHCLNVFITANPADRVSRICEAMQVDERTAEKMMHQGDSSRAAYYNFYSAGKWGDAATYDLCINSSVLGIERTAEFIQEYALELFECAEKDELIAE